MKLHIFLLLILFPLTGICAEPGIKTDLKELPVKEEANRQFDEITVEITKANDMLKKLDDGFFDFAHLFNDIKINQKEFQNQLSETQNNIRTLINNKEPSSKLLSVEETLVLLKNKADIFFYLLVSSLIISILACLFAFLTSIKSSHSPIPENPDLKNELEALSKGITSVQNHIKSIQGSDDKIDKLLEELKAAKIEAQVDPIEMDPLAITPSANQAVETTKLESLEKAWPDAFQEDQPLYEWQNKIKSSIEEQNPDGLQLYASLVSYNALHQNNDTGNLTIGHHMFKLSKDIYAYLEQDESITDEEEVELIKNWIEAFKRMLDARSPGLEIKAFYPNDSVNTEQMERIGSGTKANIEKALSWLIIDKSQDSERILHKAEVL